MQYFPPSALRWLTLSGCAALWLMLHVGLALRDRRRRRAATIALAWTVPGAGAVLAWREGARLAPIAYALAVVAYALLWISSASSA